MMQVLSAFTFHATMRPCDYAPIAGSTLAPLPNWSRPGLAGSFTFWMLEEVFFPWSTLYIEFVRYDTHLLFKTLAYICMQGSY
jgi:hypothetical protein